jgi:hypothetical protein
VQHLVPRAKGGTDRLTNVMPAHPNCNKKKWKHSLRFARRLFPYDGPPTSLRTATNLRSRHAFAGGALGLLMVLAWFSREGAETSPTVTLPVLLFVVWGTAAIGWGIARVRNV